MEHGAWSISVMLTVCSGTNVLVHCALNIPIVVRKCLILCCMPHFILHYLYRRVHMCAASDCGGRDRGRHGVYTASCSIYTIDTIDTISTVDTIDALQQEYNTVVYICVQ